MIHHPPTVNPKDPPPSQDHDEAQGYRDPPLDPPQKYQDPPVKKEEPKNPG